MKKATPIRLLSNSPGDTQEIGHQLGKLLREGDVVLFIADLGSGKTTFIQGLVRALGVRDGALSPTFIMAQSLKGVITVHHLDFYRMTPEEILAIGIQDYLLGQGEVGPGAVLIEWADRCPQIWPKDHLTVKIKIRARSTDREVTLEAKGPRSTAILAQFKNEIPVH